MTGIFACERNSLRHALINDVDAYFGETVDVCFTGAKVAAFDRVIEQAIDTVAVVLIVFGCVDTALSGNGVRAARAILKAEALNFVPQLGQSCGSGAPSEAGADYNDIKPSLVGRIYQLNVIAMIAPLLCERSGRYLGVKFHNLFFAFFAPLRETGLKKEHLSQRREEPQNVLSSRPP